MKTFNTLIEKKVKNLSELQIEPCAYSIDNNFQNFKAMYLRLLEKMLNTFR